MPRDIEGPIHRSILHWLQLVLPGALVVHVPNEVAADGDHIRRAIGKAKGLGLCIGFPDLAVFMSNGRVVMFEVKAPRGKISGPQAEVQAKLTGLDHHVAVVRSIDEVRACLIAWGIETREKCL